ncbi:MAG TPA: hypothetical protein VIX86_17185 [Streptosporangiaceae bacterium]
MTSDLHAAIRGHLKPLTRRRIGKATPADVDATTALIAETARMHTARALQDTPSRVTVAGLLAGRDAAVKANGELRAGHEREKAAWQAEWDEREAQHGRDLQRVTDVSDALHKTIVARNQVIDGQDRELAQARHDLPGAQGRHATAGAPVGQDTAPGPAPARPAPRGPRPPRSAPKPSSQGPGKATTPAGRTEPHTAPRTGKDAT